MIRKPNTIAFWVGRLPHWEVEEGRYFVTIHLAGAIPSQGKCRLRGMSEAMRAIRSRYAPDWLRLQRRIFKEMERWLDHAECCTSLQNPEVAATIVEAIECRSRRGDWRMFEYTVMPSHVHLFFELPRVGLKEILEDFKRWTGHRAVELQGSLEDRFWQREWFDHWSRSDEEDHKIARYIRENPVQARLVKRWALWPYRGTSLLPDDL